MLGLGLRLKIGKVLGGLHALLSAIKARATTYENQDGSKTIINELSSSNLLDNASILLTPTAYSSAVLHSLKDGTSDSDFDVTTDTDATRINENGIIEDIAANQPRINYTPSASGTVANSGHILLEPQRENAVPSSVDFPAFQGGADKDTSATITAPDGTTTADLLINNGTTGNYRTGKINVNPSGTGAVTSSVFVKYVEGVTSEWVGTWFNTRQNWFNVKTGTLGTTDSGSPMTFESYPNGWYRLFVTQNAADFHLWPCSSDNTVVSNAGEKIYFWGTQKERGDFATSYIPTSGTATTRTIDTIIQAGNTTLCNSTQGTLYCEIQAFPARVSSVHISVNGDVAGAGGKRWRNSCIIGIDSSNRVFGQCREGDSGSIIFSETRSTQDADTNYIKCALKWKSDDIAFFANGSKIGSTETSPSSFYSADEFDQCDFTRGGSNSFNFQGKAKAVAVYTTALSDSDMATLTS